jgi:hypothetical protein
MKHTDEIEKLFQESFEQFEVIPPDELKANIDRELHFNDGRSKKAIWWFGSIIALLVIGSVSTYILTTESSDSKVATIRKQNNGASMQTEKHNTTIVTETSIKTSQNKTITQAKAANTTIGSEPNVFEKVSTQQLNTPKNNKVTSTSSKTSNFKSVERTSAIEKPILTALTNPILASLSNTKSETETKTLTSSEENKTEKRTMEEQITASKTNETGTNQVIDSAEIVQDETLSTHEAVAVPPVAKKSFPILISLSAGSYFALSQFKNKDVTVKEKNRFQAQVDVAYNLAKSRFSVQSGFNMRQSTEIFGFKELVYDSLFYGILYNTQEVVTSEIYLQYSNRFDTIRSFRTDTVGTTSLYKDNNRLEDRSVSIKMTSYNIPLMLRYSKQVKNTPFYLDLSTGMSFNVLNYQLIDPSSAYKSNLTYTKTGMNALLKSHLRYQFNKIGVSLNTNFVYDLKPVQFVDTKRNRFLIDVGVGLHYKF